GRHPGADQGGQPGQVTDLLRGPVLGADLPGVQRRDEEPVGGLRGRLLTTCTPRCGATGPRTRRCRYTNPLETQCRSFYSPTTPSASSRRTSRWPLCRAVSSIMWTRTQRRVVRP